MMQVGCGYGNQPLTTSNSFKHRSKKSTTTTFVKVILTCHTYVLQM